MCIYPSSPESPRRFLEVVLMIFGPFPPFSWSYSRRRQLDDCPRGYYWNYYGYHNGWLDDADPDAQLAYRLKKLTSLHMYVGNVVHELAVDAISRERDGASVRAEELIQRGRELLNRAYLESKDREAFLQRPKDRTMFRSFYYDSGPSQREIDSVRDKLFTSIPNLLASASFAEAVRAPFVEVEEPGELTSFRVNGYQVYARPDLLYRDDSGTYHLVDWKTGKPTEGHIRQLRVYGLFLQSRPDLEDAPIEGHVEYLYLGERADLSLSADDLEDQRREIDESVATMRSYLESPEDNKPLPRDRFPLKGDIGSCRWCNFYELCREEIEELA
jgi:hypothetical protein